MPAAAESEPSVVDVDDAKTAEIDTVPAEDIDALLRNVGGLACAGCMSGNCESCPFRNPSNLNEAFSDDQKAQSLLENAPDDDLFPNSIEVETTDEVLPPPSYKTLLADEAVPIVLARPRKAQKNEELASDKLSISGSFSASGGEAKMASTSLTQPERPLKTIPLTTERDVEKAETSNVLVESSPVELNRKTVVETELTNNDSYRVETSVLNKQEIATTPAKSIKKTMKSKKQAINTRRSPTRATKKKKNEASPLPKPEEKATTVRGAEKITIEPEPTEPPFTFAETTSDKTESELSVESDVLSKREQGDAIDLVEEAIVWVNHSREDKAGNFDLSLNEGKEETEVIDVEIEDKAPESSNPIGADYDPSGELEEDIIVKSTDELLNSEEAPKHRRVNRAIKPKVEDLIIESESDDDETPDDFLLADLTLGSVVDDSVSGAKVLYRLGLIALKVTQRLAS